MKAVILILLLFSVAAMFDEAAAQISSVQSLLVGPSIRASGMGRSSAAVFWGGDADYWANPALLGYHDGLRFEHGKTQLVPDLADDVYFRSDRFTLARWGIGITATAPFGRNRLDYGETMAIDEQGHNLGTFTSYEEYDDFGIGVSFARASESLLRRADPSFPELSRYGDIALGVSHQDVHVDFAPSWATPDGNPAAGNVTVRDFGVLLRFTPFNSIGGSSLFADFDDMFGPVGGMRLDLAYAQSKQNYREETITYSGFDQTDPVAATTRNAISLHVETGFPYELGARMKSSGHGWLVGALTPLISVGWSREKIEDNVFPDAEPIRNWGAELVLAQIVHLRTGRIKDVNGDIIDSTWGWGLGFEIDGLVGFRYDRATVPQARELDTVDRNGFTVVVHPLEIFQKVTPDERP